VGKFFGSEVTCGVVRYGATESYALQSPPSELLDISTEVLRVVVVSGTFQSRPRRQIRTTGLNWSSSRARLKAEVWYTPSGMSGTSREATS
jgi:hypothetical protein